jgi:hypothetical protein
MMRMAVSSATDLAAIFSMKRARWTSTVLMLIPSSAAIRLLEVPLTTQSKTSRSRGVNESMRLRIAVLADSYRCRCASAARTL